MERHDPALTAGAISGSDRRAAARGACLRVWGLHDPGHGVLPFRQEILQRSYALCALGRLCGLVVPQCADDGRVCICDWSAIALPGGFHRAFRGDQSGHVAGISEVAPEVWADYYVRPEPAWSHS